MVNLIYGYTPHGIKMAAPITIGAVLAFSRNSRSNAVMPSQTVQNPEGKTPKVAPIAIGVQHCGR
jgi:hypothetical protein